MTTRAIINPVAGAGRARRIWPDLQARLRTVIPNLSVRWTSASGDATSLTRAALRNGIDRVLAVGGDGTFHEVINGFFAPDGRPLSPSAILVPIAVGTGTDFCRATDLPSGLEAVERLRRERMRTIDLLRLEYTTPETEHLSRFAANVVSFGISSRVARSVNRGGGILGGPLRYLGALLRALAFHRPVQATLTLDGSPLNASSIHLGAIANGSTFGGGIRIASTAHVDDGMLDVTILHDVSALHLLRHLPRFYNGTHSALDGVTTAQGRCLTVHSHQNEPVWVEADGEVIGRLPLTVEIVPDALRLQW